MKINLLTVAPEYFDSVLASSILGRAQKKSLVEFEILSLRDFADGKPDGKKQVDDKPFGGGPGMLLKIEPIDRALSYLEEKGIKGLVALTSAQGHVFNQVQAQAWAALPALTLICGHYEGVDARVLNLVDLEISLGKMVLTGGEPAAAAMIDATVRLLPGVLGNPDSLLEESHQPPDLSDSTPKSENHVVDILEYPQYTQPRTYQGQSVPEVLLSGNHAAIQAWRQEQSRLKSKSN